MPNKNEGGGVVAHQSERFKQAARELGCDESEIAFDKKLKKVVAHKPNETSPKPMKRKNQKS